MPDLPSPVTTIGPRTTSSSIGGFRCPKVDETEPVLEDQLQLGSGPDPSCQVELGLVVERRAEPLERLLEPVVTDVVESCGRACRGNEVVGPQRHDRPAVVAEASAERNQLLDPWSSVRRFPGHRPSG